MTSPRADAACVVVDTNIVLDLFVFADAAAAPLRAALDAGTWRWMATPPMREELERVLGYPQIAKRLAFYAIEPAAVMAAFDARIQLCEIAPKAPVTCTDADDQKFIDLAVAHRAVLLSKDKAVLTMKKRLAPLGVQAVTAPA